MLSKTKLIKGTGWTPVIDSITKELGIITSAVFGVVWRYCQMEDGECWASQETIAKRLNIERKAVGRHIDKLAKKGYLIKENINGEPCVYRDTGKAGVMLRIDAYNEPTTINPTTYDNLSHPPTTINPTKKEVIKERDNKNNNGDVLFTFPLAEQIYCKVTGNLTFPTRDYQEAVRCIGAIYDNNGRNFDKTCEVLGKYYKAWTGRKTKDGAFYYKGNTSWLDWAVSDDIPHITGESSKPKTLADVLKNWDNRNDN